MREMADRRQSENVTDNFDISLNMPKSYPEIKARPTAEGGVRDRFFAAVAELPDEITVVRPFCPDGFKKSNENTFYVSPDGSLCMDVLCRNPPRSHLLMCKNFPDKP